MIDCYSVKPIDAADAACARWTTRARSWSSRTTGSKAGSATRCWTRWRRRVRSHGRVIKVGVTEMAGSATPEQLRAWAGIDAASIAVGRARPSLG